MGQPFARSRVLSTQKTGNTPAEYEDAAAHDGARGRFAVADGASDAYDSGRWARLLVESFVAGRLPAMRRAELDDWVATLAQKWSEGIPWDELGEPRHWYRYEKARLGDFATFLGLEFEQARRDSKRQTGETTDDRRWRALAVGDACLFQVRGNELVPPSPVPIASSSEFNATPALVSTDHRYNRRSLERLTVVDGCYRPGDTFLLATDALACSMIAAWEDGEQPWSWLAALTPEGFDRLVARLRRHGHLRNDDVTLLVVQTQAVNSPAKRPSATSKRAPRVSRRAKATAPTMLPAPAKTGTPA